MKNGLLIDLSGLFGGKEFYWNIMVVSHEGLRNWDAFRIDNDSFFV